MKDFENKRFWPKVRKTEDCWEWLGKKTSQGYGVVGVKHNGKKIQRAHRYSFLIHYGHLPDLFICHTCDNAGCVNPDHLFVGTVADNNNDRFKKGRYDKGSERGTSKLNEEIVRFIRSQPGVAHWAREFGVSKRTIINIKNGTKWRHVE